MTNSITNTIAHLNDQCRKQCMMPVFGGQQVRILMTHGVRALGPEAQIIIAAEVASFNAFTPDNDPHGEQDFGALDHAGERILWKIDYYAPDMEHGSDDPSDPEQTVRVLTIMLASEY